MDYVPILRKISTLLLVLSLVGGAAALEMSRTGVRSFRARFPVAESAERKCASGYRSDLLSKVVRTHASTQPCRLLTVPPLCATAATPRQCPQAGFYANPANRPLVTRKLAAPPSDPDALV